MICISTLFDYRLRMTVNEVNEDVKERELEGQFGACAINEYMLRLDAGICVPQVWS